MFRKMGIQDNVPCAELCSHTVRVLTGHNVACKNVRTKSKHRLRFIIIVKNVYGSARRV